MSETVHTLPLDTIEIDESLQPRCDGLDEAHIAALMETSEVWPPVEVVALQSRFKLLGGFHRYEAAKRLGFDSIQAHILPWPADGDLAQLSFDSNASHGKPLTTKDRKRHASRILAQHPEYSDREIGRRSGLNHQTVGTLRTGDFGHYRVPERKPGALETDISIFDGIRRAKNATRAQKAIAGYIKRLATALSDPYEEDVPVEGWSDDPAEMARACFATMAPGKATALLSTLAPQAAFILAVAAQAHFLTHTTPIRRTT